MSILIVEDNAISARILELSLKKGDHETVVARTGKEAVELLGSAPGIGLVVTDAVMPDMDGFQLLRVMRESSQWRDIPAIMCTSLADADSVRKAGNLGCKHYLIKPVQPAMLMRKVAGRWVPKSRSSETGPKPWSALLWTRRAACKRRYRDTD